MLRWLIVLQLIACVFTLRVIQTYGTVTWKEARQLCFDKGSELFVIDDSNKFHEAMAEMNRIPAMTNAWVGIYYDPARIGWYDVSRPEPKFVAPFWEPGFSGYTDSKEGCLVIEKSHKKGLRRKTNCEKKKNYICKNGIHSHSEIVDW